MLAAAKDTIMIMVMAAAADLLEEGKRTWFLLTFGPYLSFSWWCHSGTEFWPKLDAPCNRCFLPFWYLPIFRSCAQYWWVFQPWVSIEDDRECNCCVKRILLLTLRRNNPQCGFAFSQNLNFAEIWRCMALAWHITVSRPLGNDLRCLDSVLRYFLSTSYRQRVGSKPGNKLDSRAS